MSGGGITGQYKDITSSWQWLVASEGAYKAVNTRHDDTVNYHATDGFTWCAAPEQTIYFPPGIVDGIQIRDPNSCGS